MSLLTGYTCVLEHDRDVNVAENILNESIRVIAAGHASKLDPYPVGGREFPRIPRF